MLIGPFLIQIDIQFFFIVQLLKIIVEKMNKNNYLQRFFIATLLEFNT
jgi:hypothetical protein